MIRFLHRGQEVAIEALDADTTVLDYLRDHCGLTGTKEGCASGDCGACTVVSVRADERGLAFEALNACIAPLGGVHGRQLLTVEDLKDGEAWHPVQRAMIECHASQCGFCTPGFVMSLFALYHDERAGTVAERDERIREALGGNLCRCTGYRPIVDAAKQVLQDPPADRFARAATETRERLLAITRDQGDTLALGGGATRYQRPATAQELAGLLAANPQARLVAGGTDLLLELTQQLKNLPQLIDIKSVSELHSIDIDDAGITLGAAVSHRGCEDAVLHDYPELRELIERFGSLQIRTQGTVVGNVATASPIGDWPPVLLALGARLRLRSLGGSREIPVDEFFTAYRKTALRDGEFIESLVLPRRAPELWLRAYKISKRYEDDISSVCLVAALTLRDDRVVSARVACGGMAAIPKRAPHCEAALAGRSLRDDDLEAAVAALDQDFEPISDVRASAGYRSRVAGNLLRRLQQEYLARHATRVHAGAPGGDAVAHG